MEKHNPNIQGINLIGTFNGTFGLSVSAKQIANALKQQNIPYSLISIDDETSVNHPALDIIDEPVTNEFKYPVNLFCFGINLIPNIIAKFGVKNFNSKHNIGLCFWETNLLPKHWIKSIGYLDEIWVVADYLVDCFSAYTNKPIKKIPHPLEFNLPNLQGTRQLFGLPDKFTFLFCFDFYGIFERKNPIAAIRAFKKAFPNSDDVQLVIKSQNGNKHPFLFNKMLSAKGEDPRIFLIDKHLEKKEHLALMNSCDCYVSLHRSEGFGLTMAESMLLEKPVIATGYSGNLAFMNEENSFLCPYKLISVGKGCSPYPEEGVWADVDIEQAAHWMTYVYHNPENAHSKAKKAREFILTHHSKETVSKKVVELLNQVPLSPKMKNIQLNYYSNYLIPKKTRQILRPVKKFLKSYLPL